jgi:hypothetical protein
MTFHKSYKHQNMNVYLSAMFHEILLGQDLKTFPSNNCAKYRISKSIRKFKYLLIDSDNCFAMVKS